jgi:hypothetical protein
MAFTVSTIPFLALIAVLYVLAGKQLLPVMMFMTVFQGAALIIVGGGSGGVSLAPAQAVLFIVIVEKLFRHNEASPHPKAQELVTTVLFLYGGYAIVSAIFCPFFFQGILVSNPRSGLGAPLTWSMYNITQLTYLFLGIAVYLLVVYRTSSAEIERSMNWYLAGSTFAAYVAMYQWLAFNTGLPFPSELLHSNSQHVIFEAYDLGGFTRVNSTFTEAAAAAGSFTTALGLVIWRLMFVRCDFRHLVCFISLLIGLVLTRSSMGYAALAFIIGVTALLYIRRVRVHQTVALWRTSFACAGLVAILFVLLAPGARTYVGALLDKVLFTKTQSASYEERTAWNNAALAAASDSYWMGAGWGSLRASSLIANILGTVGIPGLFLFGCFCVLTIRFAMKSPHGQTQIQKTAIIPILVSLLDCVLAGPEMTDPVVWFMFGVAASCVNPSAKRSSIAARRLENRPQEPNYGPFKNNLSAQPLRLRPSTTE